MDKFTVMADGGVGSNTVGAAFDPAFDVMAHLVPMEAEADAMEGFAAHEVSGGGRQVE